MMANPRTTHHDLPLIDPAVNARPEGLDRINVSIEGLSNLLKALSDEKASKTELQELIGLAPEALNSFAEVAARIEAGETVSDALLAALALKAAQTDLDALQTAVSLKAAQADLDALQTQVNNFSGAPIGSTLIWDAPTLPDDYLERNGATLSRADFPELWAWVSAAGIVKPQATKQHTEWGDGDGSTTFSLPDWRAEHLVGWDHGRGVDPGRGLLSWQADAVKSHNHSAGSYKITIYGGGNGNIVGAGYTGQKGTQSVTGSSGYTGSSANRVRTVAVMFLVKYR